MFNFISWQGYWTFLAIVTGLYYLLVYLLYFKRQNFIPVVNNLPFAPEEKENDVIHECMGELNAFFEQSAIERPPKEEMIYKLKRILKKYPSLKDSSYRRSLNHVFSNGFEKTIAIHLSEEELGRVWLE